MCMCVCVCAYVYVSVFSLCSDNTTHKIRTNIIKCSILLVKIVSKIFKITE